MKHSLAQDLSTGVTKALDETSGVYHEWYELAMRARSETQKLLDKLPDIQDADHAQIMNELAQHGMAFFNSVVGSFMTQGMREEGTAFRKHHKKGIQIIRKALENPQKNEG
jgi:hypothetical protein